MMTTEHFLNLLRQNPDHGVTFVTPDGQQVPPHFHITEVGHLAKTFLDCGGKRHTRGSCLLQVWLADDVDHRLVASKLLAIFERADGVLPSLELPVEFEFEAPVLTQLPVTRCEELDDGTLSFHTELKHTDCLAKDICLPDFSLPPLPGEKSACAPGSGCC
jgi:hypothetical protein